MAIVVQTALSETLPDGVVIDHAPGSVLLTFGQWTEGARRAALSLELVRETHDGDDTIPVPVDLPTDVGDEDADEVAVQPSDAAFVCTQCDEVFASRRALGQHTRWSHRTPVA